MPSPAYWTGRGSSRPRWRSLSGQPGSSCRISLGGIGGTVASVSTLRSAGSHLSRVRAPPSEPQPDRGP
ncbi:hypothetical protein PoB_003600100 [Plakobranchus ocellatus]|uniref:Uncharacterized protein n=1 Tax=Plakobranchus ocellatus TaxID=259542 RepID=A0AAV4ASE2_9GAST|nr:hypothetical protein PoB_003600100 [Plakobranchus ocellatus]